MQSRTRNAMRFAGIMLPVLLLAASCGREEVETDELIRPVRYEPVYATGGSRLRTFSGTAQARLESRLSFKVPGTIARVAVKVGDAVSQGQLIAALDDHDYRLQVQEAEAALEQAQAGLRNATSIYERTQTLYENQSDAKQDLDAARAAYESATARVASIEKRLELARLQVDYTQLKAPFDGAVASVLVEENENTSAGMPVVVLTAAGAPEVSITVPEVLIAQIQPGMPASVTFRAIPEVTFPATVREVGVAATSFATTFPVTVQLREDATGVRPGMAAEVAIRCETSEARERVIVRSVAVGEDRSGRFVFVVDPLGDGFGIARRRAVTVGEVTATGLEILSGLTEGDLVVTAGVSHIADGQKVRLQ